MSRRKLTAETVVGTETTNLPIHVKYRPGTLRDIYGHTAVVASLKKLLISKSAPHAFLFTGPSGCGKTTFARIIGNALGVSPTNLLELDAATNSGIDDMRGVISMLHYQGFGESPLKLIILDECHQLSKQAWQSILKSVEEPPPHVYFVFCTTESEKVPNTIKTRCSSFTLDHVKYDDIMDLLEYVCEQEGYVTKSDALNMVARACGGSPRQALVMLAKIQGSGDLQEIAILLAEPGENKDIINLCRDLVDDRLNWGHLAKTLKSLNEQNPESVRIVITCYISAVLLNTADARTVVRLLNILDSFSVPCNPSEKWAPILRAFGAYMYP